MSPTGKPELNPGLSESQLTIFLFPNSRWQSYLLAPALNGTGLPSLTDIPSVAPLTWLHVTQRLGNLTATLLRSGGKGRSVVPTGSASPQTVCYRVPEREGIWTECHLAESLSTLFSLPDIFFHSKNSLMKEANSLSRQNQESADQH